MRNALLFRLGGLGDLLVAFPAISLVRKKFPSASLTLVCWEAYGSLLQETGVVNEVMREDSPWLLPLFSDSPVPGEELAMWLRGYDLIMGWMHGQKKDALEKAVTATSISGECRFFYYQPEWPEPISQFFFRQTSEALRKDASGSFSFKECAKLPLSPAQKKERELIKEEPERKFVVVHPGSGSEKKCWAARNFLEIIERLTAKKVKGALVTGEAEKRMDILIEKTALPPGWTWLRSPSLIALSNLLQEADLYLGNDSGITHLAAACGTEAVAVFRKELVTAWEPYGRIHLLSADSLEEISVESVWKTVSGLLHLPEIPF
jgi:ADP-heptose:LPS heptosyltransferase